MIKFIIFNVKRFLLVGVLFLVTFLLNLTAFGEDCTLSVNAGIDKVICKGSEAQLDVTVTGGGSGVSYSWSPGTGLTDPAIPNPKAHPDVTTTYTVTIKEGSCTSTDAITVTVNPLPMVDFTFLNNQCSGSAVAFTPSVSGTGPFTYSWNFGDLSYSMEQNPSHEFTSLGCETKLFSVTLTVTDANSCSSSVTHNITIKQKPDINFYDVNKPFNPFSNCGDASAINPSFSITVGNSSVSTCISSYSINWGDGNTASGITFPLSHTYSQLGAYNMVITAMGTNGCSNSKTYVIKNVSNPSGGITSPGSTVNLCAPTSDLQFAISDWATNSPGTTYQLNYGDDSQLVTLTQEQMVSNSLYYNASNPSASLNYPVPHSYTSSNCPKLFYTINLTVTNACGETKGTISNISVLVKPAANFTAPTTGCTNSNILFNNTTIAGYGQNCSLVYTKKWNFGDGTADVIQTNSEQSANHTYLNAGTYTVRLTTENFCGSSTITKTICIESPLTPAFSLNENTGCIPLAITATNTTNISNNCAPPVYNWDVSYSAGNCGTSSNYTYTNGTGQTSANPSFLFANPGTYTIRLSVTNSCGTFNTTKTVTVKKPPVVSISGIPAKICQTYPETRINPVANVTNCGSQTLTYEWSFPGGSPATSSNADPGTVSYGTSGTYPVTLMVTNECASTSYNTSFTINPGPTVNDITSQVKCKGEQSDAITFGGTVPNTVYNWTNDNAGIGLALSGSGNIDPFISVNNGATIQTATITVTPAITATGCTGTPKTFTITVHPQATVNPVSNISLCNNAAQGAINFSGNVAGTTFSWVNNNPDIGLAASGTGNIPSFTAVNTSTTPLTATISVTPFNTRNCAGPVRTFTITVNPTPGTMALADKEFCNGVLTSAITFSNAVAGTGYSWASSNPSIGLPSSGTGNILPFTPVNLSSSLVTSTITVTPAANGCSGTAQTFTISVNPNLTVTNSPLTQTICSEGTSTQVDLTSNISGATFTWTASSTAGTTGFTPSGTSFIPPQTLVNSTFSNGTVTYTIIPVADGCAGSPVNYTIIVRPRPNVSNNPKNKIICSGSSTNMILTSNVTGTTYDWTASVTEGNITGFSPTGSGNINDLLSNSGTTPGTVRYVITPTANGCSGLPVFYDVSVQPVAHITNDLTSQIICSGTASTALNLTSDVTGVTFNWAVNATSGITGFTPAGNGNSIPSAAINSTLASKGTITYTITPSINGCAGVASAYLIEVNPAATVTNPLAQTICSGSSTSAVTLTSNVPGTSFTWNVTPPPSSNITGYTPGGSDMIGSQLITNSGKVPENIIYHIIPSSNLGISCPGIPADYIATVNPLPVVLATPLSQEICSGNLMNINLSSPVNNVTFTWTVESVTGPVTGAQSGSGSLISQILINPSSEKGSVRYKITPHFSSCSGEAIFADVTVKPHPSPTITGDNSACIGSSGNLYRTEPGRSNYIWTVSPGGVITQGQGTNELSVRWDNTGNKTISVNYENSYGCTAITPTLINVTVNPILPVSVTISGRNNICPGTTVTFTATPVNGGLNPAYQWQVNGSVVGTNSANYTYDPKDGDTVACQLLSDAICPSGNPALSNGITMVVYSDLPARLTITENANNVCPGENVSFTAVPFNGGSSPSYQWLVNGIKVGSNLPVYSYNPLNGDAVSCQLTSSNNCSAEQIVQSNLINMSVSPPALQPSFSFEQTDDCAPVTIKFKNNTAPGGVAYMWDFGDGNNYTTETTEDVTHIFHNYSSLPKVFNVSLKVITKFTHCFNVLTKQLTVKPEFFAGSQVNYKGCSPLVQKFENANPGAKSYRWMSDKNTLLSTEFQPTLTFNASGNRDSVHTVYLIAESMAGCIDTIVNTIKVSRPLEKPSFTYSATFDCKSVTYTFRNTSPEGAELFVWDFDDGTINKTVHSNETVIHTFINGMDEPVIFNVKLTSINGSYCSLSETKQILVNPEYTAGYPVTFQGCTPLTRTFTNAYSGSKSYQWKTEKGVLLSQEMNPTLTFTSGIDQDSTHLIYLITESITGCKDTILNKVIVRGKSKGGFTISPSEGCAPLLVQFTNTSSSLIKSQEWSFGDSSDYSTLKSPRHTFINSSGADTIYKVTFVAFNQYGCSDTITSDIHLLATPQIDFLALPSTQTHPDRTIKLTNLTPPGNWTFSWNFGDQKTSLPGNVSEYQYDLPGEYVITLTAKGDRCESIERNKVIINPGTPMASFEPDTSGCAPLTVNFRNYSQNGSEYQWDFGNGNMSENFSPSTIYHEEGTYTVKLNVLNQHGAMSTTERTITVHPVPKALFDLLPNKVKIPKQDVTFFNYSENAKDYLWDFGDGNTSPDKEPVYQYTKTGLFDVTLFITSAEGCRDTLLLREAVEVFSDGLKVPNAFIPYKEGPSNGHYVSGDPRNNIFYPAVAAGDVVEYELMIFNRWGNLLFVSREIERGWDGYYNGRLCPQDVYIWKIRCKFISGSIITKSGDVTLIQ